MIVLTPHPQGFERADILVPARGRVVIDFGAGAADARVVVTGQSGVTAQSVVVAQVLYEASADHSADEHFVEEMEVRAGAIVPGVGFTILARTRNRELFGRYNVGWTWS
jgi:hypothetical protein